MIALTPISRRGLLLILSSPSGAGKTTLSRQLLASDHQISMSISLTTRLPRPGEIDGRDYHFISKERFAAMRDHGDLLEWAEVFGNLYATPKQPVLEALARGHDMLFDIDWQGTQQLVQEIEEEVVRVFILPPSAAILHDRLIARAQDDAMVVAKRMMEASREISHWAEYDYVIVNHKIDESHQQLEAILAAERLRRWRQIGLAEFVRDLSRDL